MRRQRTEKRMRRITLDETAACEKRGGESVKNNGSESCEMRINGRGGGGCENRSDGFGGEGCGNRTGLEGVERSGDMVRESQESCTR